MKTRAVVVCAVLIGLSLNTTIGQAPTSNRKGTAFSEPVDNPDVPNALLIGDSISIGYTVPVGKQGDDLKYNQIAEEIMTANGVLINDLHSHALLKLPAIQLRKGDVHFTDEGYAYLGEKVAFEIAAALSK